MPDKPAVLIRQATIADVETIARYNTSMALETEGVSLDQHRIKQGVHAVITDSSKGFYAVADIESRVIGQMMVTFEWSDWRNGIFWWIQSVYVIPQYRQLSVLTKLHEHVRSQARKNPSVCGLRLYVEEDNKIAQKAYKSLNMMESTYKIYESDFVIKRS